MADVHQQLRYARVSPVAMESTWTNHYSNDALAQRKSWRDGPWAYDLRSGWVYQGYGSASTPAASWLPTSSARSWRDGPWTYDLRSGWVYTGSQ
mmetsp:Transcript_63392/g.105612  ORF Transcript_63392/g.105612 Transcript_63392/m.105612 type:complete len:94 (-) Transcript_63392:1183-1464(-)